MKPICSDRKHEEPEIVRLLYQIGLGKSLKSFVHQGGRERVNIPSGWLVIAEDIVSYDTQRSEIGCRFRRAEVWPEKATEARFLNFVDAAHF